MLEVTLFTDGGSRDGKTAIGFVCINKETNKVIFEVSKKTGVGSSNIAEYRAIIAGLTRCIEEGVDTVEILSDSMLCTKQINGDFECYKKGLKEHRDVVHGLLESFKSWSMKWIPRNKNQKADSLVDEAFKKGKRNVKKNN